MTQALRVQWIDAAKGLGILLIVVGHVYSIKQPEAFITFIYAFHVPLFFFLSGVTLRPSHSSLKEIARRKVTTLLVPYGVYALLGYAFYLSGYLAARTLGLKISQFDYGPWTPLLGIAHGTIGEGRLVNAPLWFVLALFFTFLIGHGINSLVLHNGLRWVLVLVLAAIGYAASLQMSLPWSFSPALMALVFFQAGYDAKRYGLIDRMFETSGPLLVLCTALSMACGVNGFVAMAQGQIGHPGWFLLFAFSGTSMVILFVQYFNKLGGAMARVGRYSLHIMVIHMLIIKSLLVLFSVVFGLSVSEIDTNVPLATVILGLTFMMLVPCVAFIDRWLPWSVGKPAA